MGLSKKISSNCEVEEEFENVGKLTRSAATEVASGERLRKFHETSRYRKNMKMLETYSSNTDEETSRRETQRISSNCKVEEKFENVGQLSR